MDNYDSYRMIFDYHTHTEFSIGDKTVSHAIGSLEENVWEARKKGLSSIGISNHGPGHVTYGMPMKVLSELRGEAWRLSKLYPDIQIRLGVEANIINLSGELDVKQEDFDRFDYLMAGYHYGTFGDEPIQAGLLLVGNWLHENVAWLSSLWNITLDQDSQETLGKRLERINTERMVSAIHSNKIMVVTHPGDKGPYDIRQVAKACAQTGTWMEINNFHRDLTVEGIRIAAQYDVKFVIGSDAHRPEDVGCFQSALERAFEAGLDVSRIVNIEKRASAQTVTTVHAFVQNEQNQEQGKKQELEQKQESEPEQGQKPKPKQGQGQEQGLDAPELEVDCQKQSEAVKKNEAEAETRNRFKISFSYRQKDMRAVYRKKRGKNK